MEAEAAASVRTDPLGGGQVGREERALSQRPDPKTVERVSWASPAVRRGHLDQPGREFGRGTWRGAERLRGSGRSGRQAGRMGAPEDSWRLNGWERSPLKGAVRSG